MMLLVGRQEREERVVVVVGGSCGVGGRRRWLTAGEVRQDPTITYSSREMLGKLGKYANIVQLWRLPNFNQT